MINWCENCAIGLYNKKHHNLQGIGNPWNGKCIVVSNVDYDAYKKGDMSFSSQVEIIKEVLHSSTGGEDFNLYIIPLVRCNERISCKLDSVTFNKCLHWFANDIRKFNFNDILLLGDAAKRFLNCTISPYLDTMVISNNNRRYFVNYSPFTKFVSPDKFEDFKKYLLKWYNAVNNNDYSNYEIKKI